jgi:hypothetical protein
MTGAAFQTATPIAPVRVRWPRSSQAETDASDHASAACYRRPENIGVVAVIISELKLRDVQRHVLGADLVECADHAAFEDRPEAFNRVGVDRADNVFVSAVPNGSVLGIFAAQRVVSAQVVSGKQAHLVRDGFANEAGQSLAVEPLYNPRNDVALALDCANDTDLAGAGPARAAIPLVPMLIAGLSADVGFVNLDDAHELTKLLVLKRSADAVAHVPSGLVGAEAHVAVDLPGADAFLAGRHQVDDTEPLPQIDVCVLKNGPDKVREAVSASLPTVRALPAVFQGLEGVDVRAATARAIGTVRPAASHQVTVAGFLVRESRLKLSDGHLHDLLGLFSGHGCRPCFLASGRQ